MAICRFGPTSDVFVDFKNGMYECCACRLNEMETFSTRFQDDMREHLEDHEAEGHKVPAEAFTGLNLKPKRPGI